MAVGFPIDINILLRKLLLLGLVLTRNRGFVMKIIAVGFPIDINILLQKLLLLGPVLGIEVLLRKLLLLGSILRIELLLRKLLLLQPAGGVRLVPRLGSAMSFCSEVWSSAELNKKKITF